MRNRLKLLLTLGIVVTLLCFLSVVWYVRVKPNIYKPKPIRPNDFPEILIAPENSVLVDHTVPSVSGSVPHTYGLSFIVHEPYPSDDTHKFIENHLSSNGWQRLNYDLLNPYSPAAQTRAIPEFLDPQTVNMLFPKGKQKGVYPGMWIKEDWIKDDEYIGVSLSYAAELDTKRVQRDKVYVNLSFFGRKSWIRPYILKYKELHSEEFGEP
jgi:hypothetical protein